MGYNERNGCIAQVNSDAVNEFTDQHTCSCCYLLTEVWHIAYFWVSYGRCTMPGYHLWDGQKDCPDVGQVRCFEQETPRKMHHCMLLDRLTMFGSPVGPFVGLSWRQQITLHVELFCTSDRVTLDG